MSDPAVEEPMTRLIRALGLIAAGIVGGELVGVDLVIVPTLRVLPVGESLRAHQTMGKFVDPLWPIHTFVAAALGLALVPLERGAVSRVLLGTGAALMGAVAVISATRTVPINHEVATWDPEDPPPPGWREMHQRWAHGHRLRTAAGMFGFVAYVLAAVLRR